MKNDFQALPRLKDSISYVYTEHAIIEQEDSSICIVDKEGRTAIPVAGTTCLLIGPGTKITHAAVKAMAENGCSAVWCGENLQRFYSFASKETRSAKNILKQARLCVNDELHLKVVERMYIRRFPQFPKGDFSLQQLRGLEGIRVKEAYKIASRKTGINWSARQYKNTDWDDSDDINKALSMANAILYSVCQAAVESLGFSSALGFIHTGKMLSFVYDVADLYKTETTIPAAFETVASQGNYGSLEGAIRTLCRKKFSEIKLLKRIPADIAWVFDVDVEEQTTEQCSELWDQEDKTVVGGINYGETVK